MGNRRYSGDVVRYGVGSAEYELRLFIAQGGRVRHRHWRIVRDNVLIDTALKLSGAKGKARAHAARVAQTEMLPIPAPAQERLV